MCNRILSASPEAWRFLGWRSTDPATGRLRILPDLKNVTNEED
jgi:hypothetical protein